MNSPSVVGSLIGTAVYRYNTQHWPYTSFKWTQRYISDLGNPGFAQDWHIFTTAMVGIVNNASTPLLTFHTHTFTVLGHTFSLKGWTIDNQYLHINMLVYFVGAYTFIIMAVRQQRTETLILFFFGVVVQNLLLIVCLDYTLLWLWKAPESCSHLFVQTTLCPEYPLLGLPVFEWVLIGSLAVQIVVAPNIVLAIYARIA
ncbi:hypothetical protein KIPB_002274 [Kipferlia bialata]|uniref:Uncharacterized protein n=1 Tax=Kipferlia bialata TaxID=797122 RepID=A0A9K3GG39_9EUKA|nr:hypothetical protein KIPB_002274 [Kipferlia bialata]|eukprot:g2274.t1